MIRAAAKIALSRPVLIRSFKELERISLSFLERAEMMYAKSGSSVLVFSSRSRRTGIVLGFRLLSRDSINALLFFTDFVNLFSLSSAFSLPTRAKDSTAKGINFSFRDSVICCTNGQAFSPMILE